MLEGWRRASTITAVLGALGAAAILPARSADSVKIGILWPLTGNAAAAGQASKAAAEVAVEIVNNPHPEMANLPLAATAGLPGLGGAKLELVFADHQGNPSVAQQQALRLINEERVHVLFGAYHSSCSLTATAVAERYGIPFMVGESAALNITGRGFKWVFRGTPIASDYAATYMRFFDDMRKAGKKLDAIAVVNENTDYGTSVADEIEAAARKADIPVAMRIPYGANSADVSAQVLQLKERRPDVVIFISYTPDAILYIKTMKNLDYLPPMVIGDDTGFSDPSFHHGHRRHRPGRDEPQRLGHRQAGQHDRSDQRDVQGQDRPRSRRHQRAQHAELLRARGSDQSRGLDRPGKDSPGAAADRSQGGAADDGLPRRQVRCDGPERASLDLSHPAQGQSLPAGVAASGGGGRARVADAGLETLTGAGFGQSLRGWLPRRIAPQSTPFSALGRMW